jgi:hypothetical protein
MTQIKALAVQEGPMKKEINGSLTSSMIADPGDIELGLKDRK